MDGDTLLSFILVLFFVLLGGVFSGTEMALVSLRESQIKQLEKKGKNGTMIAGLARNPNRFLSAVQIGVTLSGFFSAAYGAATLAPDLAPILEGWGMSATIAGSVSFIAITLAIAYLSLVLGELVPKRLAMQSAVRFTRVLAPPLNVFAIIVRPVIWLLSVSTNAVVTLLGGDPSAKSEAITAEELRYMVTDTRGLGESSRTILSDVLGAGDRLLREVMRPRTEVSFLAGDMPLEQARARTRELPYSRYPVTGESVDDILGFVHIRDLVDSQRATSAGARPRAVADITRDILPLPGTNNVLQSLTIMRREGHHIALVVDEYGGTDGIVTLEDLVEELVGEIYDEYDSRIEPEDAIVQDDNTIRVDGGLILQELDQLAGISLPEGDYETVAGFVIDRLGRIPRQGDTVEIPGYHLKVIGVKGMRIDRVLITPE